MRTIEPTLTLPPMNTTTLPQGIIVTPGQGNLSRVSIDTELCTAELYLHGAHLCHWQPKSQKHPVLWMSQKSWFEPGKPIRGGVPICFPWFGPHPSDTTRPAHGFARLQPWQLMQANCDAKGVMTLLLFLAANEATKAMYPHDVSLSYTVRLGHELHLALSIHNRGDQPIVVEEALHTYLSVSDVKQVYVTGLAGATYIDKTDQLARKKQGEPPIAIGAETDRLYLNTRNPMTLTDPQWRRRIIVSKTCSQASVVWNPWINKSKAMSDFGDDEWPGMICLETVNASDNKLTLPPLARHTMTTQISVQSV